MQNNRNLRCLLLPFILVALVSWACNGSSMAQRPRSSNSVSAQPANLGGELSAVITDSNIRAGDNCKYDESDINIMLSYSLPEKFEVSDLTSVIVFRIKGYDESSDTVLIGYEDTEFKLSRGQGQSVEFSRSLVTHWSSNVIIKGFAQFFAYEGISGDNHDLICFRLTDQQKLPLSESN